EKLSGLWARVAGFIGRRSRMSWVLTTLVLLAGSFFATTLKADGLSIADSFTTSQESVTGQQILGTHFPAGSGNPAVITATADKAAEVVAAAQAVPGIDQVVPYTGAAPGDTTAQPKVVDGLVMLDAVLSSPSDSPQAQQTVRDLRDAVHAVPGADAKVG